jgi:hypothetical protein
LEVICERNEVNGIGLTLRTLDRSRIITLGFSVPKLPNLGKVGIDGVNGMPQLPQLLLELVVLAGIERGQQDHWRSPQCPSRDLEHPNAIDSPHINIWFKVKNRAPSRRIRVKSDSQDSHKQLFRMN